MTQGQRNRQLRPDAEGGGEEGEEGEEDEGKHECERGFTFTNTTADLSFATKSVYSPPQTQRLLHIAACRNAVMAFQILAFLLGKQKAIRC